MSTRFSSLALAGVLACIGGMGSYPPVMAEDDQPVDVTTAATEQSDDSELDLPEPDAADESTSDPELAATEQTDPELAATEQTDPELVATEQADPEQPATEQVAVEEPEQSTKTEQATAPTTTQPSTVAKKAAPVAPAPAVAKPPKKPVLLPGTGSIVKGVGDDFEDEKWKWNYNHPKSSEEQDKRMRGPMGRSVNGRWFEGPKRGTPDVVKRIELPAPGLEGSTHGMLIASLHAGIPGRTTYQMQQDDLIYNMQKVTGRGISVVDSPSVVTRVYMPPFEQWEKRNGPTFGFRAGCYTHAIITGEDHPDKGRFGLEEYWPGMFVCFEPANAKRKTEDSAYLRIRGGRNGGEIRGPKIDQAGWWTLGLSFSPDGMVHYFASHGVDDLTMDDHITSQFPYGYRTELLKTFFYNVCTRDDGKTWSTPWVVDDPKVYFIKRQVAAVPKAPTRR